MDNVYIFSPEKIDPLSKFRGGGRIVQILKENLPKAKFISDLDILLNARVNKVKNSIFVNPYFNPFQKPKILKRVAQKQVQIIFDVIPLKYPNQFPVGIRGKFNLFLNKLALKNYHKIITISRQSKKDIADYLQFPEKKIEVVYPTLSQSFLKAKNQSPNRQPEFKSPDQLKLNNFCLYVGDVNWNKNLVNLARAIKIINVTCVFVGKAFETLTKKPARLSHPWQKEFHDFLTEVNDDKRFVFLGYVTDNQLAKIYQQAKVNILVSRDEGFGFSYLEAASQGCPSILSDIELFHEIAKDSAWFAKVNDPYDIANKIGEVYFNSDLKDKLAKKAYQRSLYFNQKKFKNKITNIFYEKNIGRIANSGFYE